MIMLLESLAEISDGFITDQLTHSLQTATMAERADADEEMIFGALMHDIGKAVSVPNHGPISAEMIKPYRFSDESWFALCEEFTDDWDQQAFDPDYGTLPLEHFEPLVRKLTAAGRAV